VQVNKRIKTPDGITEVNCDFSEEEADIIFTVGLTEMLRVGAIPFSLLQTMDASKFGPGGNS
jgi:hypothetical protein